LSRTSNRILERSGLISSELKNYSELKKGSSFFSIVINTEGTVEDKKLLYGKNEDFNKVALEIVNKIPNWKPGEHKGKLVNASYNFEVKK